MAEGFGAFGKIPSAGDFFRFGVPNGFVTRWDTWLQTAMLDTKGVLGGQWDDHYMSAPIWRFSLSAGLAGAQKVMGVLMPSVDRVGRQFPLTFAGMLQTPGPAQLDHFREDALFEHLEDLALAALDDTMTRDRLEHRLSDIAIPQLRSVAPVRVAGSSLILTQGDASGLLPELSAGLVSGRYTDPSVWSAIVNDVPRLMVCHGLPGPQESRGLFDLNAPVWSEAKPI